MAQKYNETADALNIIGDGGRRAVVYFVDCDHGMTHYTALGHDYKTAKRVINDIYIKPVADAILAAEFQTGGAIETIKYTDAWGYTHETQCSIEIDAEYHADIIG